MGVPAGMTPTKSFLIKKGKLTGRPKLSVSTIPESE
jgi:hypothetical protein